MRAVAAPSACERGKSPKHGQKLPLQGVILPIARARPTQVAVERIPSPMKFPRLLIRWVTAHREIETSSISLDEDIALSASLSQS